MDENKKLKEGSEVILYIPYSFTIGDENIITNEKIETISDCKKAIADLYGDFGIELNKNVIQVKEIINNN